VLSAPANTQEYTIVDVARLVVYGISFYAIQFRQIDSGVGGLVLAAIGAAFIGSFLGTRLIKKGTLRTVQLLVGTMLVLVGLGMVSGLVIVHRVNTKKPLMLFKSKIKVKQAK
jgi:uncharacterized membrane protein YfcA